MSCSCVKCPAARTPRRESARSRSLAPPSLAARRFQNLHAAGGRPTLLGRVSPAFRALSPRPLFRPRSPSPRASSAPSVPLGTWPARGPSPLRPVVASLFLGCRWFAPSAPPRPRPPAVLGPARPVVPARVLPRVQCPPGPSPPPPLSAPLAARCVSAHWLGARLARPSPRASGSPSLLSCRCRRPSWAVLGFPFSR